MKRSSEASVRDTGNAFTGAPLQRATLVHVARLAGVGLGTASRALGDGKRVSEPAVRRVQEAARRLGYRPNELARNLKVRRSRAIGLVIPNIGGEFMATCVRAAQSVIRECGYISVIAFTDDDKGREIAEIDYLVGRQIDGILLVPAEGSARRTDAHVALHGTPVVTFDQPASGHQADEVIVSNQLSAEKAVRHLMEHGHKRIAYVGIDRNLPTLKARQRGYRKALNAAGLEEAVHLLEPDGSGSSKLLDLWNTMEKPPTAVFLVNELTSVQFLGELAARDIQVPGELAIIAFDDVPLSSLLRTPLSVMRQPAFELGCQSATLLMQRVSGEYAGDLRRVVLHPELILRQSCGCARARTMADGTR